MLLDEYLEQIRSFIERYTQANLILASDIGGDFRTECIGIIRGRIDFIDESTLHFMEYLDLRYSVDKLTYSFHYQGKNGELIFRYDNAQHKPKLDSHTHKHLSDGRAISAKLPMFEEVLREIVDRLL